MSTCDDIFACIDNVLAGEKVAPEFDFARQELVREFNFARQELFRAFLDPFDLKEFFVGIILLFVGDLLLLACVLLLVGDVQTV